MLRKWLFLIFFIPNLMWAQEDLLAELESETSNETDYTFATWKGTKVVNLQTNELPAKGVLQYTILHRFGSFNDDFLHNFLGLDNAQVRLTLDYSPTDWLNVGLGHTGVFKTYDFFAKYRLARQSKGARNMPVSITGFSSFYYSAQRQADDGIDYTLARRSSFVHELVIARKFSQNFSAQIVPTIIHFNLAERNTDVNTQFALGLAARYKVTPMHAITVEWVPVLNPNQFVSIPEDPLALPATPDFINFYNSFSIGMDIETGGHVFQLFITNARGVAEPYAFARNTASWLDGDIHFGFNISRVFTIKK
jgi:hypothetical protein